MKKAILFHRTASFESIARMKPRSLAPPLRSRNACAQHSLSRAAEVVRIPDPRPRTSTHLIRVSHGQAGQSLRHRRGSLVSRQNALTRTTNLPGDAQQLGLRLRRQADVRGEGADLGEGGRRQSRRRSHFEERFLN